MSSDFGKVIADLQAKFVWGVVACQHGDEPAAYHAPFTYPGAVDRKQQVEPETPGRQAKVVLDLVEMS